MTLKIKHEDVRRLVHPGEKTTTDLRIWIYELIAGDEIFMSLKSYVDYESKDKRFFAPILALVFLILGIGILLFYETIAENGSQ